jgi:hypothetical protein
MVTKNVGLLDLSAESLGELPELDEEILNVALGRLVPPCGAENGDISIISGYGRMWQNYRTER